MHVQTQTATMAYSLPALPASPTLTNPDMILPYGEYESTQSPPQHTYRPPSPGDDWGGSGSGNMQFSIGTSHTMGPLTPTTPIIYGNGTMLSDIGEVTEVESTPGRKLPGPAERRMRKQAQNAPLRSSPTIGYNAVLRKVKGGTQERKTSMESTSTVRSEGQSAELFKDFDDGLSVDDSVFQGDDEESVADSYSEEVIASETQRLARNEPNVGREEDRNSSAALSRRAEQILLNAKKRLNVRALKIQMSSDLLTPPFRTWKAISPELEAPCTLLPLARCLPFIAAVLCHDRPLLPHKTIIELFPPLECVLQYTDN